MKKQQQQIIVILLLALIGGTAVYFIGDSIGLWAVGPSAVTTPTTKATSTFTFIDYNTGEDVSAWVEASVWTPDPDDLPFGESEDIFRIANYDEDISSSDAEDISIDLRSHDYAWLQIDPDYESDYGGYNAVFAAPTTDDYRLLIGGANYDYVFYVYHEPSDVDISILDKGRNSDTWNVSRLQADVLSVWSDDINGTVVLDMPWNSSLGLHAGVVGGDEWDIDDDDLGDMTDAEIEWLKSQRNFRTIAPYYDLIDDDLKDYEDELELWTNCFAVEFAFNGTINMTNQYDAFTDDAQVNFTLYERDYTELNAEIVISGASLYVIFTGPITFYPGQLTFDFEMVLGDTINVSTVRTGRILTPEDDDTLGAFTAYSAVTLRNYLGFIM